VLLEKLSHIFLDDSKSKLKDSHFKIFVDNDKSADKTRISDVIDWAKTEGYLTKLGIDEDHAEILFRSMLVEHNLPEELIKNKPLREELKRVAIDRARESAPIRPDEANRVEELITSGEIFHDIFYSFNVIFSLAKSDNFFRLDENFKNYIKIIIELPKSILSDFNLDDAFEKISTQIAQIKAGETPDDPEILDDTLKTIYSIPDIGSIIDAISTLLVPENESLRIALSVYARLNGINLEQQDIDKIRDTILDRNNPDLGSFFSYLLVPENAKRLAGR